MRVLEEKDIILMEKLMLFHQAETQKFLAHIMKKYYKKKDRNPSRIPVFPIMSKVKQ